jgi:hypothetical protein
MSGESRGFIKLRSDLVTSHEVRYIARETGRDTDQVLAALYALADWFESDGRSGRMIVTPALIDAYVDIEGFERALSVVKWLLCGNDRGRQYRHLTGFCDLEDTRYAFSDSAVSPNIPCALYPAKRPC